MAADPQTTSIDLAASAALGFRCADTHFALPIDAVVRASYLVAAQPIPEGPEYLVGVTQLGHAATPLVDLALRLGLPGDGRYRIDTPLVWCRSGETMAALVVDEVAGVLDLPAEGPMMGQMFSEGLPPLKGVLNAEGAAWLLLDVDKLLAFDFTRRLSEFALDREALQRWMMEAPGNENEEMVNGR